MQTFEKRTFKEDALYDMTVYYAHLFQTSQEVFKKTVNLKQAPWREIVRGWIIKDVHIPAIIFFILTACWHLHVNELKTTAFIKMEPHSGCEGIWLNR